jgi:phosphate transport system substrate-binding protein
MKPLPLLWWVWLILILSLAGCAESEAITPTPTLAAISVDITPAARPVIPAIKQCALQIEGVEIILEERFSAFSQTKLHIRLDEPEEITAFAAQIAVEELAVILHPQNPIQSLTTEEIRQLFSGQIDNWSQLGGEEALVNVWVPLSGDETRTSFEADVMLGIPVASNASLAPDPAAMQQAVGGNPNAIGYLAQANLTNSDLHAILLGVRRPVLVLAEDQPPDSATLLIACLQTGLGQQILLESYP